jgi:hypothetical protein
MIDQFVEETSVPYSLFSADGVGKTDIAWISEKWHEARTRMMLHNESEHILIIDEIQKIVGWSEIVKKEWDQDTREKKNLKVILLGSSRLLIQKGLEESLEGRYESLKMGYWEWEEMRNAFGFSMEQFIYFGGFPGLAPYISDEDRWRKMMEDSIAVMSNGANPEACAEEISRCELMKEVIERNIDSDPNSYLNGTQISHSELTLYTIDLTMEQTNCHPDFVHVSGMLESALNKDIEHAFNTGQKVPAEDIHVALDSCNHIDSDIKTAFSASLDAVVEREMETSADISFE